jgi:Zn-dependent peptidase ImmA (M78 family)/transcriptional regulator with XRE-family HTH domain
MLKPAELGKCLQEQRKRVRLSQTAVSDQLKVTRQVVSAYESGKRAVSAQELQLLCNLFRIYPNDLLGFTRAAAVGFVGAVDFRMNEATAALSDNDRREVAEFLRRIPPDGDAYLSRWRTSHRTYTAARRNPFGSMQQLAEAVRKGADQEEPPINIYLLAERLGVLVTPTYLDKAAAVVHRADESRTPPAPPWVLVNCTQPMERQRFSIGHEIAHLFLHQEELVAYHPHYYKRHFDQKEIEADAFAAEVLMPRGLIEESVGRLTVKGPVEVSVILLSSIYQVSFAAMITRLYSLNLISKTVYDHLGKVKPSTLQGTVKTSSGKRLFKAEKFLPTLKDELGISENPRSFNQDVVRKLQEIAYTRYLGQETRGGSTPAALNALEPPNKVYEKVALWVAGNYPMNSPQLPC